MKKILIFICCVLITGLCLTSCNLSIGMGNFSYKHIHFTDMAEGHCATIVKWYDNAEGIEVKTEEYGYLYCSEGSYILFESGERCPYCE